MKAYNNNVSVFIYRNDGSSTENKSETIYDWMLSRDKPTVTFVANCDDMRPNAVSVYELLSL